MNLVDKVTKIFKANNFSIVEVGVIATRLGIGDKKEEIHERLYERMFDEIVDEIDKTIPVAPKSALQSALEYMESMAKVRR
jgi:hypothetical protein